MEPDRLSSLPDHIIDIILSYMPIRDAVGTSVLSSKWMNKWYTLPNLVFDTDYIYYRKFVKMVDHVLLVHSGPINMFKICYYNHNLINVSLKTDVDRWILHLTRMSIQELVLEVWIEEQYKIPWCLFSCQSLRCLKLCWCWLKPPTKFEGFKNLKSLYLYQVTISEDDFENLISSCPLLESLILIEVDSVSRINIHAPNLIEFDVLGKFEDINFDNVLQLTNVYVDLSLYMNSENNQSRLQGGGSSNLLKFFDHLPHLQGLTIQSYFLKYLAAGVVPVKLPTPCMDLGGLSLCINFDDLKEISAALCLLRSSPTLETLEIYARFELHSAPLEHISDNHCWEDTFSKPDTPIQVRHVTIENIYGFQPELDFIRFLLLYSPVLKKLILKPAVNVRPELVTELLRFKRASGEAEVIYHVEDSS